MLHAFDVQLFWTKDFSIAIFHAVSEAWEKKDKM